MGLDAKAFVIALETPQLSVTTSQVNALVLLGTLVEHVNQSVLLGGSVRSAPGSAAVPAVASATQPTGRATLRCRLPFSKLVVVTAI